MGNNYQRLKDEADINSVVEYLGIQKFSKGSNVFIHCPLPRHDDKHPTNCYYKPGWNNVYCQRCGKAIKAIDLIMYTAGLDYGHAADTLWAIEGCPEWYYEKKRKAEKAVFSLSGKEAKIIGIYLPHSVGKLIRSYDEKPKLKKTSSLAASDPEWIEIARQQVSWQDFMSERDFKKYVVCKCDEKLRVFEEVEGRFNRSVGREWRYIVPKLFAEERRIILEVRKRASQA